MTEVLPPWRPLLRGARQREGRSPQARWLQLATLGCDGAPRVRTLVFRGWAGPPQPGAAFDPEGPFPEALGDEVPQPESFELVRIELEQVELLELTGHPHQRRRWRRQQEWLEERLNP